MTDDSVTLPSSPRAKSGSHQQVPVDRVNKGTMEAVLTNAKIVTRTEIVDGTVSIEDGAIRTVDTGASAASGAVSLDGDYLLPGLIELHTDNLERHLIPRPGVAWPVLPAILAHDRELVGAGITTVFDALRIGELREEKSIAGYLKELVEGLDGAAAAGLLRADHHYHLRCEVCCAETAERFQTAARHPRLSLVSIMDHTPGQRQFTNIDKYREYYGGKYGMHGLELESFMAARLEDQKRFSDTNRKAIVALAHELGITLASHDDATEDHVDEAARDGMAIAEFPTSVPAAVSSRRHGLRVLMGAPNVVRGGSHSGNVSALDLAEARALDILSSDYVPSSLLQAAFVMAEQIEAMALPESVAAVTANPAEAVGLTDRGEIKPGKRADLIQVRVHEGAPLVRAVWRNGERVA
jgi:alpha-D-ribose 1-methylphosphonate 5-triphosphate diphosphatase